MWLQMWLQTGCRQLNIYIYLITKHHIAINQLIQTNSNFTNITLTPQKNLPFSRYVCLCVNILSSVGVMSDVLSLTPLAYAVSLYLCWVYILAPNHRKDSNSQSENQRFFFFLNGKHLLPKISIISFICSNSLHAQAKSKDWWWWWCLMWLPRSYISLVFFFFEVSEPTQAVGTLTISLKCLLCSLHDDVASCITDVVKASWRSSHTSFWWVER